MKKISVLLEKCPVLNDADSLVPELLGEANLWEGMSLYGKRILVKPNLLRNVPLACTSPEVVAAACLWLKEQGASVTVADSPGFGSAAGVAASTGLSSALSPLGLVVSAFHSGPVRHLPSGRGIRIAREAMECDGILSAARFKAHSQMRLTLACKNCYGCIPGLRKAFYHTREGQNPDDFANLQAALLSFLPPVAGLVDGIEAMHETGPATGKPYPLGIVGVSSSPVALDESLCRVVGLALGDVPLQAAFIRARHPDSMVSGAMHLFPRKTPDELAVADFRTPKELTHTSFRPLRLLKSCLRRVWAEMVH